MAKKRKCKAKTKAGKPCRAYALEGHLVCLAHADAKTREKVGFRADNGKQGRPRKPRMVDVVRERVDGEIDEWYQVLLDAREATRPVLVGHGEDAYVEHIPDHRVRLRAFREAMDRAHGRPVQVTEIGGGPKPVRISHDLLADPELRDSLRAAARRVAANRSSRASGSSSRG